MVFGIEELKVGARFDISYTGHWYKEITEILDIQETKALVKAVSDYGSTFYIHFKKNPKNNLWEPFITGISKDGLLY